MTRPWVKIETVETAEGPLELRQRGDDFLMTIAGRVLMSSMLNSSEKALSEMAIERMRAKERPQVLISGLGLGYTLRAALDLLPPRARVAVVEINPIVVRWCQGPLAGLTGNALDDPRVTVIVDDVVEVIRGAANSGGRDRFDAILLDLYAGPNERAQSRHDPFYGPRALERSHAALQKDGVFGIWSEDPDAAFEKRLGRHEFRVEKFRAGKGGRRHTVYLAFPRVKRGDGDSRGGKRAGILDEGEAERRRMAKEAELAAERQSTSKPDSGVDTVAEAPEETDASRFGSRPARRRVRPTKAEQIAEKRRLASRAQAARRHSGPGAKGKRPVSRRPKP